MKNLTNNQKIAVLRILFDIVLADGYVDEREVLYCKYVEKNLTVSKAEVELAKQQNSLLALAEINELSPLQKQEFATMMGKLIIADRKIHYNEVKIYDLVCAYCHINQDLEESFEPELLQSISFVEPPLADDVTM